MRVVLFVGKRHYSTRVFEELCAKGVEIIACVSVPDNQLIMESCSEKEILYFSSNEINNKLDILNSVLRKDDWLISYLYPKLIAEPVLQLFEERSINFHPGPLPEHRGVAGCCFAILEQFNYWGVTAHQIVAEIDAGDIFEEERFPIESERILATDLERATQRKLFELFTRMLSKIICGENIQTHPQKGKVRIHTRKELERLKEIQPDDSPEFIDRKIRAFWLPPHGGTFLVIKGDKYTLVNESVLSDLERMYDTRYEQE